MGVSARQTCIPLVQAYYGVLLAEEYVKVAGGRE
jgi:hypothetical protein